MKNPTEQVLRYCIDCKKLAGQASGRFHGDHKLINLYLAPELFEALVGLVLTIAPDYDIDSQEHFFQEPLRKALEVIKKVENKSIIS